MSTRMVRMTLTLPTDLLEAVDRVVREGKARSRNEFVAAAVRRELAAQEHATNDATFAVTADDTEYQTEALAIEAEFATASEEALRLAEAEQRGDRRQRDG